MGVLLSREVLLDPKCSIKGLQGVGQIHVLGAAENEAALCLCILLPRFQDCKNPPERPISLPVLLGWPPEDWSQEWEIQSLLLG